MRKRNAKMEHFPMAHEFHNTKKEGQNKNNRKQVRKT